MMRKIMTSAGAVLACALLAAAPENEAAGRLKTMRSIADIVSIDTDAPEGRRKVERIEEPIYRYYDPAREFSDGTVWAWGRSGRPVALLTIAPQRNEGQPRWLCELTSLAPVPLATVIPGFGFWAPAAPGVTLQTFPKAPAPAGDGPRRLLQMRELARRFKAHERFAIKEDAVQERYELRLLPQPVHRYADPASGLTDGAVFFLSYGNNPEIILLIEARRAGQGEPSWSFGMARIAGAELHADLDGKTVWEQPRHFGATPRGPYWVFVKPMSDE